MKTYGVQVRQTCSGVKFRLNVQASSLAVAARRALRAMHDEVKALHKAGQPCLLHRPEQCDFADPERITTGIFSTRWFEVLVLNKAYYATSTLGWEDYE